MKSFKAFLKESNELLDAWKEYKLQSSEDKLPKNITKAQLKDALNSGSVFEDDDYLKGVDNTEASSSVDPKKAREIYMKKYPKKTSRDYKAFKKAVLGGEVKPSIVIDLGGGRRHLLSGNTRAVIAKAYGLKPRIKQIRIR